jgi:hypothetical protein
MEMEVYIAFLFWSINVGSEDAQTKLTIDLLCITFGEVSKACVDRLPYTRVCTCFLFKEKKQRWKQARALPAGILGSLNVVVIVVVIIIIIIIIIICLLYIYYFICSPNFYYYYFLE